MKFKRRRFLQYVAGTAMVPPGSAVAQALPGYIVGVGNSSDPYQATMRAIRASGQFPAVAGCTVAIKPNLVKGGPSTSGITTDPHVVRAMVDTALNAGASSVLIVEGSIGPAPFSECGYVDIFGSYGSKVQLVDLATEPSSPYPVPHGYHYRWMYIARLLKRPGLIVMTAAKLKTHSHAGATLSCKDLVGLAPISVYGTPGASLPRTDIHNRGIHFSIVDLNLVCPIDYAVIDGIWGMEGQGPLRGTPVNLNLVLAGLNPVAVDLIGLRAMQIPASSVPHLFWAALKSLGPLSDANIMTPGDTLPQYPFIPAQTPPNIAFPAVSPALIAASSGLGTDIQCKIYSNGVARVEIIRDSDFRPGVTVVRTVQDWSPCVPGVLAVHWDGRDDFGQPAPPGIYLAHVLAAASIGGTSDNSCAWITVTT